MLKKVESQIINQSTFPIMLKHIGEESKNDCDCVPIIGNYLCWMKAVRRVIQSLYCASAHNQSITVMDSVSVNTDHFVPGLMLPRSSLWNILLCPQISSISQTNPWLMTRSVRGRRGIEGKFGEISGTNDVQSVTTGQYPHNLYRGYWHSTNIRQLQDVLGYCRKYYLDWDGTEDWTSAPRHN